MKKASMHPGVNASEGHHRSESLFDVLPFRRFHVSLSHTAIRASAGSGKTFQLTNRYLQLIAAGAPPSSILASTFTRLAAGQIRDRILTRLAEAAEDDRRCAELAEHLELPSFTREHATAVLARLANHMHTMQIRTLDSFFAEIVRAFAIELQIPIGAQVIDEEQAIALRSEAIRLMLDEHEPQKLIDLLRLLTQDASDRAITSRIDSTVGKLYDIWRETPPGVWECVPQPPGRLSPPQLVTAIKALEEAICPENGRLTSAFQKDCERARRWQWSSFLTGGLAKAVATASKTYGRSPIPVELISAYAPLVRHAIAEVLGRVREQTIATRDLLAAFHVQYEAIKRRQRAVTFADLASAMVNAQKSGGIDEISFRLDAKLAHLLLDEFQDTSIMQWNALEPLASDVTSVAPPEKSFFCVGDVKQSIYRWRDAAPEVLDELPRLLPGLEIRTLARSYRSAPAIMDAVNRVFEPIERNEALIDHPDAAAAWANGFARHETAMTQLAGYVELRFCKRAEEDEQADELRLRTAAELAAQLHQANPGMSIAILTRTNNAVARLMYELGPSRLNVAGGVSGRGGGPLTDAAPVNVVLDLLQLADHPDDTAAAFNVAMAPVEFGGPDRRWWSQSRTRRTVARDIRQSLLENGYGTTVSHWVRQMIACGGCDAREIRRLCELVALADTFEPHSTLRTVDFISLVEQTRIADIQPAAVQVMTIHQSKGLEFDAVILAELGSKLTGAGTPDVVVERDNGASEIGPITRVCRHIRKEFVEFAPELAPLFAHHEKRVVRESLSVLYVAMTRAIHGLYMIVNPPAIKKDGSVSSRDAKTLAGVVCHALAPGSASPDAVVFNHGNPAWHRTVHGRAQDCVAQTPIQPIRLAAASAGDHYRFRAATAASQQAEAAQPLERQLRLTDSEPRDRGTALHALFEQVEWVEDFQPDEAALIHVVRTRLPRRDLRWARARVQSFIKSLDAPELRRALKRNHDDPTRLRVLREHPFVRLNDGELQRGSIDRLVLRLHDDCSVAAAAIIDFKTDACLPSEVKDTAEHYRTQLEAYRAAVMETFGLDGKFVAARLVFVDTPAVVDL